MIQNNTIWAYVQIYTIKSVIHLLTILFLYKIVLTKKVYVMMAVLQIKYDWLIVLTE